MVDQAKHNFLKLLLFAARRAMATFLRTKLKNLNKVECPTKHTNQLFIQQSCG